MRLGDAATTAVAGLVAIAAGSCGTALVQDPGSIASTITSGQTATGTSWTVSPWPLDDSVAFLCLDEPTGFERTKPPPPSCARLDVVRTGDQLSVEFDARTVDARLVAGIGAGSPPWFLVVAGHRGLTEFSVTRQVIDSPLPSDHGPS